MPSNIVPVIFQPHACRVCFGRILTVVHPDGRKVQMCYECGIQVESDDVHDLCCCGVKLRNGKDAGLRCVPNPEQSPENPSAFIIKQVDEVKRG